ncbi:MAG: lipopolysaccharide transport periplasmic protein LptA [Thermodesulfobacteriota bacterium]
MLKKIVVALLALLLAGVSSPWAAEPPLSKEPIHIEADRMVSRQKDKAVVFSGQVEARQGEMFLRGDKMIVHHDEGGGSAKAASSPAGAGRIRDIKIKGGVEIVRQGLVATGDEAVYHAATQLVTLRGNAKIVQDNNMISGHVIKINMASGTTEIVPAKGSKGRVVGYFYPGGSADKKKKKEAAEDPAPVKLP